MKTICPHCGQEFPETPDEYLGMTLECPSCHQNFVCEKPKVCSECGALNLADALQCSQCGTFFEKPKFCSECGTPNPANAMKCSQCGKFFEKPKFCPECGTPNHTDALQCSQCGTGFPASRQTPGQNLNSGNPPFRSDGIDQMDCFQEEVDLTTPWRKFAEFNGRSGRKEFLLCVLQVIPITLVIMYLLPPDIRYVSLVLDLVIISLDVRRLHDLGYSGWWALLLIPMASSVLLLPLVLGILLSPSQPGRNQWGPNPVGVSSEDSKGTGKRNNSVFRLLLLGVLIVIICILLFTVSLYNPRALGF